MQRINVCRLCPWIANASGFTLDRNAGLVQDWETRWSGQKFLTPGVFGLAVAWRGRDLALISTC